MTRFALAASAAALLLCGAAVSTDASHAAASARAIQVAAVVCGGNGCTPVQTHQQKGKRKFQTLGHG